MNPKIRTLRVSVGVKEVIALLRDCPHSGFPVVDDNGMLLGLILRRHLLILLKHRVFAPLPNDFRILSLPCARQLIENVHVRMHFIGLNNKCSENVKENDRLHIFTTFVIQCRISTILLKMFLLLNFFSELGTQSQYVQLYRTKIMIKRLTWAHSSIALRPQ